MKFGLRLWSGLNGTLNRARKIDMEQRTVHTTDDSDFACQDSRMSLVCTLGDLDVVRASMAVGGLNIVSMGSLEVVLVLLQLSCLGRRIVSAKLSNAENWLPSLGIANFLSR